MTALTDDAWFKSYFEANLLDGDDIDDCGGAMLSAKNVYEVLSEAILQRMQANAVEARNSLIRARMGPAETMNSLLSNGHYEYATETAKRWIKELEAELKATNNVETSVEDENFCENNHKNHVYYISKGYDDDKTGNPNFKKPHIQCRNCWASMIFWDDPNSASYKLKQAIKKNGDTVMNEKYIPKQYRKKSV